VDWDLGKTIKLGNGIYKYTPFYHSPHTRSPIISHHFVPFFKVTLGSLIAFRCCHNQLFLLTNHITKHEGYVICFVMRRPEIYQSSPQLLLCVTVNNRSWRDQFSVVEVLGRKFAYVRVLKGRYNLEEIQDKERHLEFGTIWL